MAIYNHIYSKQAPKRFARHFYSAFTPRKLVCAEPSWHSYSAALPNIYTQGCISSLATLLHGNIAELTSIKVIN